MQQGLPRSGMPAASHHIMMLAQHCADHGKDFVQALMGVPASSCHATKRGINDMMTFRSIKVQRKTFAADNKVCLFPIQVGLQHGARLIAIR